MCLPSGDHAGSRSCAPSGRSHRVTARSAGGDPVDSFESRYVCPAPRSRCPLTCHRRIVRTQSSGHRASTPGAASDSADAATCRLSPPKESTAATSETATIVRSASPSDPSSCPWSRSSAVQQGDRLAQCPGGVGEAFINRRRQSESLDREYSDPFFAAFDALELPGEQHSLWVKVSIDEGYVGLRVVQ